MRYRKLGRTGYEVSEIGYGAWGIGKSMWVGADDTGSMRALHEAVECGVNFIDTALAYGDGHSEELVGRLLRERRERIYVATKIPPKNMIWPARGALREVFPGSYIVRSVETSLRNLGVDIIDIIQLHVWDPSWLAENEWYDTLLDLQRRGRVAHLGVSVNDHQPDSVLDLAQSGKVATIQVIYNIFEQSPEERLFPLCLDKEVGVIARVPLDEGALTGTLTPETRFPKRDWRNFYFRGERKKLVFERIEKLKALLGPEAETLPELALKFCLHHQAVGTVIAGMRSVDHVRANAAVSRRPPLSASALREVRAHRWEKNFYS